MIIIMVFFGDIHILKMIIISLYLCHQIITGSILMTVQVRMPSGYTAGEILWKHAYLHLYPSQPMPPGSWEKQAILTTVK